MAEPAVRALPPAAEPAVDVDLSTGPATSYAGLRRAVAAVQAAGADLSDLATGYPAEWAVLCPGWQPAAEGPAPAIAEVALSGSERRLHRESEQTFRVLAVAARALCQGSERTGLPLALRGIGRTDLASLRGLVRATEYAEATGQGRLLLDPEFNCELDPPAMPNVDFRPDRTRWLELLGLQARTTGRAADPLLGGTLPAVPAVPAPAHDDLAARLFALALDRRRSPRERVAAAIRYGRLAFFTSNWEGMGIVAAACLPAAGQLNAADVTWLSEQAFADARVLPTGPSTAVPGQPSTVVPGQPSTVVPGQPSAGLPGVPVHASEQLQSIEFEPALLRHPADVCAYLLKLLGIQASFAGRQDDARWYFRSVHALEGPISAQTRAQAHLYTALILTKRTHQLPQAIAELEAGFAVVPATPGEPEQLRRERGWLHNLRALVHFRQRELAAALEHEKSALACVADLNDASSLHLRVNVVSNISVLQESTGRADQALQTWLKLNPAGSQDQATFVKHHAYRTAGLALAAGDHAAGVADLQRCLDYCVRLTDDFHETEVALELGACLLDAGDTEAAKARYEQAREAAARLGDPYRMALAEVGRAAASGTGPEASRVLVALASLTSAESARELVQRCRSDAAPRDLLPRPRTKLNRPFDLIPN